MKTLHRKRRLGLVPLVLLLLLALAPAVAGAATITIVNNNAAGVGFNDPTPVAPVGGNPGVTLGAQRLYIFQYAASIWGALTGELVTLDANTRRTRSEAARKSLRSVI